MGPMIIQHRDFSFDAIAESGQCFRMRPSEDGTGYVTIALGRRLEIRRLSEDSFSLDCTEEDFDRIWRDYLDLDTDYDRYRSVIDPDDEFLLRAAEFGRGIRILRQEPWEMLISFIISQRKSIPAIRTAIERLSEGFGRECITTSSDGRPISYHAFPTPEALCAADPEALAACGLGYRLPYVREAAERAMSGELETLSELDTQKLIEKLMDLKGVGVKVASCIALFGYHRLEIPPVDVWIRRVIDQIYGGSFPESYGSCAGVLQQYMFNYARLTKMGA